MQGNGISLLLKIKSTMKIRRQLSRLGLRVEDRQDDKLIWPFDKCGEVTAKSAYDCIKSLLRDKVRAGSSSSRQIKKKLWKVMWVADVPPKIRNFLWKACSDCAPTMLNLKKRRAQVDGLCLSVRMKKVYNIV